MPFNIRAFKEEDALKVASIVQRNLIEVNSKDYSSNVIDYMNRTMDADYFIQLMGQREMFVAIDSKDNIVGVIGLEGQVIYSVFVSPEKHGKGVGKSLMVYVENLARNKGIIELQLPASLTALDFYKKLGYTELEVIHSENYGESRLMTKKI